MIQLLRFAELSPIPFCSPSAICLSSIAPISMKIQLPLVFRISPWQWLLFECSAACTFLIQLIRFAELSPIPLRSPTAICLSSILAHTPRIPQCSDASLPRVTHLHSASPDSWGLHLPAKGDLLHPVTQPLSDSTMSACSYIAWLCACQFAARKQALHGIPLSPGL